MDIDPESTGPADTLIDKLERLEGRATRNLFTGDHRPAREIRSAARLAAFDLLNAETTVPERKLFALVDSVACWLAQGGRNASEETARLALEIVVGPALALAVVRILVDDIGTA
ncbi:MAG: hypothetical protein DLM59_12465 [Pseudonocardiales bacterium]|nr:MAG: hypothetical protein DLM59_12465 [Pseudonocardiales bacterium]